MKILPLCGLVPANKLVAGHDLPGSAGPSQTGNDLAIDEYQMSDVFPNQLGNPQIMIMVKQVLP